MSEIVTGDRLITYLKGLSKQNKKIYVPSDSDGELASSILMYCDEIENVTVKDIAKHYIQYKAQATVKLIDIADSMNEVVEEVAEINKEKEMSKQLLAETKKRMEEWNK